jgi:hypothetical protein
MRAVSLVSLALLSCLASAPRAAAQDSPDTQPIAWFAMDVRGVFPRFKQDAAIAEGIGVTPANLPTRGVGVAVGAHIYPIRFKRIALGVGGELLLARGRRTLEPATEGGDPGPTVMTRFQALSPQVSLNFGKRSGWSYISGGLGRATYNAELEASPLADQGAGSKAINYGGGARWFAKPHLAFSFDVRFFTVNPREADAERPALPRMKLLMLSAGVSFK